MTLSLYLDSDETPPHDHFSAGKMGFVRYKVNAGSTELIDRPRAVFGSGYVFYLCDQIHEWFSSHRPNYAGEVELVYIPGVFDIEGDQIKPGYWVLEFTDTDLALLFKLAWGGQ